jgi:ubiquinone/menaquinone biosynthesis C-methylase UbiE
VVTRDRDVQAFQDRAAGYELGFRGRMHSDIVAESIDLALSLDPAPSRVLDVGCGTGLLLRELAARVPGAISFTGVDAAPGMIEQAVALALAADPRLSYSHATAEDLPFPDGMFDLVISTTSFDHWSDQGAGLAECRRVLAPGGHFVLTDLFSVWLLPTLAGSRRDRARTQLRATRLLAAAGFRSIRWHRLYAVIINAVTATALPQAWPDGEAGAGSQ